MLDLDIPACHCSSSSPCSRDDDSAISDNQSVVLIKHALYFCYFDIYLLAHATTRDHHHLYQVITSICVQYSFYVHENVIEVINQDILQDL